MSAPPAPVATTSRHFPSPSLAASTKRPASVTLSTRDRTKPTKRARVSIDAHETHQVSTLHTSRLPFADADVYYVDDFIDRAKAQRWHDELVGIDGWYQPTLKMYGKEITQSRKIAAFATDRDLTVKYSGALVDMQYEIPGVLSDIWTLVEDRLGVKFNHVMCNLYEDGSVYIGNHRDNRENRVIASLSLGAPRTFIMEHDRPPLSAPASSKKPVRVPKRRTKVEPASPVPSSDGLAEATTATEAGDDEVYYKKWALENGSLVVMQGRTQERWKHSIPKEPKIKQSRISLTFRQLVF